jgi:hypothetical protein
MPRPRFRGIWLPARNAFSLFDTSRQTIDQTLSRISAQMGSDPRGTDALTGIQRLAADEIRILEQMRDQGPRHPPADSLNERERTLMGDLQARVALLSENQERLFTQARLELEQARKRLFRTVMVCGILGPLGALFVHLLLAGRMVRRLRRWRKIRRLAHGLPLEPLPRGSDEPPPGNQPEDAAYLLRERELKPRQRTPPLRPFDRAPISTKRPTWGVVTRFNQAVQLLKCPGADDRPLRLEFLPPQPRRKRARP